MIDRALAEQAYFRAAARCDPARWVREALELPAAYLPQAGRDVPFEAGHEVLGAKSLVGIAVGKAALAMARGVGPVDRGIVVVPAPCDSPPPGWALHVAAHPEPDERSMAAGASVIELVDGASADDIVLVLVSGGASALIEQPLIPLADFVAIARAVMAAGAPIAELNTVRAALSAIKGGRLALRCAARIITLVASDVIGDRLDVVGSGPTIGPWLGGAADTGEEARRIAAIAILDRLAIAIPDVLRAPVAPRTVTRHDRAALVVALRRFADEVDAGLRERGVRADLLPDPITGDVADIARRLASVATPVIAWGEPTVRIPADHGDGGRAQQLALALAKHLRGGDRSALVAGTDGVDGPPPRARAAPAGAFVDGTTWDAIVAAGIDPDAALARCDAGSALHAVGALFVPGATGVNHADVVLCG